MEIKGGSIKMLNQVILVGKVISIKNEEKKSYITLSISIRDEEDCVEIELSDNLAKTTLEYITEGATLGVKAKVSQRTVQCNNNEINTHAIIAEKLTFINARK